jgi:hypothetical protein
MKFLLAIFLLTLCYSKEIKIGDKEISLLGIEKPIYDGTNGYSVLKIRKTIKNLNIKKDFGTYLIEGQVSIIFNNPELIYLISKKQYGGGLVITDVFRYSVSLNEFTQIIINKKFENYVIDKNEIAFISSTDTTIVALPKKN